MRDILLTVVVFGSLPFIIKRPYIGVLIFAWLSYMNPHRLTWTFAFDMPFAAIVAVTTMVSMLLSKESKRLPMSPMLVVWLLWIVWMNVTTVVALEPEAAVLHWNKVMKIQLMALISVMLLQSRERINALIWVIVLSIGFYGIKGGIFSIIHGGQYLVFGPAGSFFGGNNGLGVALLMILPLARYLQLVSESRWIRHGWTVGLILIGISILATYSRGAFLGAAVVALYLLLKSRKKFLVAPLVIVAIAGMVAFMPDQWYQRIESIQDYQEDGSATRRINAWMFAYNLAKDHPLTGGGYEIFNGKWFAVYAPDRNPDRFVDAHSIYFEVLGEHGFVGLALYLTLGIMAFRQANRIRRLTRDKAKFKWAYDLASMIPVGLVGYAVAGAFAGSAYFDLYYHLIGLLILTRLEVMKGLHAEHRSPRLGVPSYKPRSSLRRSGL